MFEIFFDSESTPAAQFDSLDEAMFNYFSYEARGYNPRIRKNGKRIL